MTLYDAAGGRDRLLAMTAAFYGKATADDLIGPMFGRAAADHANYLAGWMSASFGGPRDYLAERGDLAFVIWKHAGLRITDAQRARWARLMMEAAAEVDMPRTFTVPFRRYVDAITRATQDHSNADPAWLKARLGLEGTDVVPQGLADADR